MPPLQIFRTFWWKNLLQIKHNWLSQSIIFFICIALIFIFLAPTKNIIATENDTYDKIALSELKSSYFPGGEDDYILCSPDTDNVQKLMQELANELEVQRDRIKYFRDSLEMQLYLERKCKQNCFAIYFENLPEKGENGELKYTISSSVMSLGTEDRYENDEQVNEGKSTDDYIRSGFFTLKTLIDRKYISEKSGVNFDTLPEVLMESMPTIALNYGDSARLTIFGVLFNILLNIMLLTTFLIPLVEEKQNGLRKFLKLASPFSYLDGVTFFLIRLILYIVFLSIAISFAVYLDAIGLISVKVIIILFVHQVLAGMSFAYLISLLFESVFYVKIGGLVLLMLPNLFTLFKGNLSNISTCIFYAKAFKEALNTFQMFNNKHKAFEGWTDIRTSLADNSWKISTILLLLELQIIVHFLLYWYFSEVYPKLGGSKIKCAFKRKQKHCVGNEDIQLSVHDGNQETAIIIENLCKKFKSRKRKSVIISDNLNMVIKNKEITVLLGHNGAGKTTTLSMIIGSASQDSGKITVCGESDFGNYRHLIGFCPQYNIFLPYLTCKQHLIFFSLLREVPKEETEKLAKMLLESLKLTDKEKALGATLSGGMKRRLSVGLALSGDTKVIILDEPSSGLDFETRRELWDILLEIRKTKAILITTHHMEEAEILGDTVSILSNGKLIKSGTPLELKKSTGSGYILKLELQWDHYDKILNAIYKIVPSASIISFVSPTLLINLPYDQRQGYSEVLKALEDEKNILGIKTISMTDTSLDEVFLSEAIEKYSGDVVDSPQVSRNENSGIPYSPLDSMKEITSFKQYKAIIYKRCLFTYNDYIFSAIMILITALCCWLAIWLMRSSAYTNHIITELPLNLNLFQNKIIYIHENNSSSNNFIEIIKKDLNFYKIEIKFLKIPSDSDLENEIWNLQKNDLTNFLQNVIGILDIQDQSCHIYFQTNIYHSSIILLNLIDNSLLKLYDNNDDSILTFYRPVKRVSTDISASRLEYYPLIVTSGFFAYLILFLKVPFIENESGFRNLQVSVPTLTYWLANLFFDTLIHFLVCLFLLCIQIFLMSNSGLYSNLEQSLIMFSIFVYGISYLPLLYIFANNFRSISTISTYLLLIFIISSIMAPFTSHNVHSMQHYSDWIMLLRVLPDFNLNHQLRIINENFLEQRKNKISIDNQIQSLNESYGSTLSTGNFFIYAIAFFACTFTIFIRLLEDRYIKESMVNLLNAKPCRLIGNQCSNQLTDDVNEEDSLVVDNHLQQPQFNINPNDMKEIPLSVQNLCKRYKPHTKLVVKNLNFDVKKSECFGLLGVNGAGKTSTFQMMASNATKTSGSIKILGYDIDKNQKIYNYKFGYCPQFDALNLYFTSSQLLSYMGELRGLCGQELESEVIKWLKELEMESFKDVKCCHYSGGMKRKLNSALAMIGMPALILLDEPTNGVDPASRRLLWKCIKDMQKKGTTIVLTSHSMDECEQLCNRLAIMANGKIQCIGSIQSLKVEHENGFTIIIKMKDPFTVDKVNLVKCGLLKLINDSTLREEHYGTLTFVISTTNPIVWSDVFLKMEKFYETYMTYIEDYSINESKLEDIILKFKKQPNNIGIHDV